LPRGLDEGGALTGFGESLACAIEHRLGGFSQGHVMPTFGQPQRHMPKTCADIQNAQLALGQRFAEVGLQHGQANRTFGAAIDLFRETRRQLIEMAVTHLANLRSLSASLLRTTASISSPSSL